MRSLSAVKVASSRFAQGFAAPWEGLFWLVRRPGCWGLALLPTLIALVLLVVLSGAGIWVVQHLLRDLRVDTSTNGVLGALAHPLAGNALEALAARREKELGVPARPEGSAVASILRSLRISLFGLLCTLPLVLALSVVTLVAPPLAVVTVPLKLLLTCTMLAWDIVDYPLSLQGAGVRARLAWFGRNFPAALGMGAGLALMFCVPFAQLVLVGAGVAGATKLVRDVG